MTSEVSTKQHYERYWSEACPAPTNDPMRSVRSKLLRRQLEGVGRVGVRLLDCGSGDGWLLAEARRWGIEAVGLEISERAVARAQELHADCESVVHSIEDRPWPVRASTFDVVVALEVIEHLLQPRQLLMGAHEALRPGGHVALTTPYHGLPKRLALSIKGFDRHFAVEGPHIRFFSDGSLRALLTETGFRVRAIHHYGRLPGLWAGVFAWAQRV